MLKLSKDLILPDTLAGQTVAIVGIRGSGKTNTAGVFAEELLDLHHQIVVLDPTNAWWGLRSDYRDVFIFGGDHGDLDLKDTDGKVMAEFVVHERVSAIFSLRHMRKAAMRRFVTAFAEELYHLKGKAQHRVPLTVFIDEAPLFIPQRVMGEQAQTAGAIEDLASRGRNTGFGVVLIGQRPATINKDVLSQADTIITHRLISPQDRKALSDWIEENATLEQHKAVLASLAELGNGAAWVWSPQLKIMQQAQIRKRHTFDSSAAPDRHQKAKPPKRLEDVDLDKLKGRLAEVIVRAELDDPKKLRETLALERKKNAELTKELTKALARRSAPRSLTEADRTLLTKLATAISERTAMLRARPEDFIKRVAETVTSCVQVASGDMARLLGHTAQELNDRLDQRGLKDVLDKLKYVSVDIKPDNDNIARQTAVAVRPVIEKFVEVGRLSSKAINSTGADYVNGLPSGERAILTAIAQYAGQGVTKDQLGVLTGYKRSSRDTYVSRLLANDYAAVVEGKLRVTGKGLDALGPNFQPLPTGDDLLKWWRPRLPDGERRILDVLVEQYPRGVERAYIDGVVGYKRSSRDTYLSRLSARKLVTSEGGRVLASAELFD